MQFETSDTEYEIQLNPEQQDAYDRFELFLNSDSTLFALLGAAGCGKSFTASELFRLFNNYRDILWLAPTWKATRVAGRFLDEVGADYEIGYDSYMHAPGMMILTTTQQALGIRPVIEDDQTAHKINFAAGGGRTLMQRLRPEIIVIDEVSMLAKRHLEAIYKACAEIGCKILIIGDPGQLPPVKEAEINWARIPNKAELTTVMRQAGDSMIPILGGAIRRGETWRGITGKGINPVNRVTDAFIERVEVPTLDESQRTVFVAYRNAVVDSLQERACQKVYGHGRSDFQPGQIVIAQSALYAFKQGMVIANQDYLTVSDIGDQGEWGRECVVDLMNGRRVHTEYLSGEDLANKRHPYNLRLEELRNEAQKLQAEWKETKSQSVDKMRREAWAKFFQHKDQTVLDFAHPFAITSHKSQGSTYGDVFVDADDIERFSNRGLYVAMTRPSGELFFNR